MLNQLLDYLNIKELYPPQKEAMKVIERNESLLMSVPTAAGKTVVAYNALMKAVSEGKKGIFLVPLRALAWEKVNELKDICRNILNGAKIGVSVGDFDKIRGLSKYDIIVATSERADSLIRHNPPWLNEVGCLVSDEIHLLNDSNRGPTLEVTLSKFREINPDIQIVGLSATVSNSKEVADWLDATLVESDFRPVPLRKGICIDNEIEWDGSEFKRIDIDGTEGIALDNLPDQCLVFVNTRRSAEAQAKRLSMLIGKRLMDDEIEELKKYTTELKSGADEVTSVDSNLTKLIEKGAAYHHAGLTNRQRQIIEKGFREKKIKALCATPTLAAGVNLPAKRVIIRDLTRWDSSFQSNQPLPVLEIQQMLGRAGRPGFDVDGEGVLIAKNVEHKEQIVETYFEGETEPVLSRLGSEPALRTHLLSLIASGTINTTEEMHSFLKRTLFGAQGELWRTQHRINKVIDFLEKENLIEIEGKIDGEFIPANASLQENLKATSFGKKVSQLYIDPLSGVIIRKALESDVPANPLGLLHTIARTPDIYSLYVRKNEMETYLTHLMQMEEDLMLPPPVEHTELEFYLWDLKTALLLMDWVEETPEEHLMKRYSTTPGDIRAKVETAGWILYSMSELSELLSPNTTKMISELEIRISNGVRKELLPLLEIESVGRVRARSLFNAGFTSQSSIRDAKPSELSEIPGIGTKLAEKLAGKKDSEQMRFELA
ncbi:MAG: DEAD/DEAH box helicase [Candidatus Thermoplasmatota archaeon]|nr:DEAD/DEAH box helicase [Candidatus Thermoplasmatota archaeon]